MTTPEATSAAAPQTTSDAASARRRRRRTVALVVVLSQLVVAALTATAVWAVVDRLDSNIGAGETITHAAPREELGPTGPLNILVLGSDSRAGEGNDIDGESTEGERADTTILMHLSADRSRAYGISLPRDAMVDRPTCMVEGEEVPGAEEVMFNTAFAVGGAQCAVQTVESLTGLFIDHFVVLDFNGFRGMVEAVGGVEVCVPRDVEDPAHDIFLPAGTYTLDPDQALDYVRERTVLSITGDIGRMRRQQAFMASLVNKVMSAGTLSQPTRVYDFLDAVTDSIEVDAGLDSMSKLVALALQFRDTGLRDIRFMTVPIEEYPLDPDRLQWTDRADRIWKRLAADEPIGRRLGRGVSADDPNRGGRGERDDEERRQSGLCV